MAFVTDRFQSQKLGTKRAILADVQDEPRFLSYFDFKLERDHGGRRTKCSPVKTRDTIEKLTIELSATLRTHDRRTFCKDVEHV